MSEHKWICCRHCRRFFESDSPIPPLHCAACYGSDYPTAEEIIERQKGRNTIGDRPSVEINTKRNPRGWL